jgi:DNA-binding transcriptional LysR family regulator
MFDWNDARYFLAIWRQRSLSAAGRHLRVQQSTVGRRLAALEAALDARLFERTPDGYFLTPAGESLTVHAERMETEALSAERALMGSEGRAAGTIRMTAPQAFGFSFVVPLLARLHAQQPDVLVELIADNLNLSLSRREADLALRIGRPTQPHLVMRRVGDVVNGLYASRDYLRKHRLRGDDLGGHRYVDFDETYLQKQVMAWLAQRARGARCVLRVNGMPGILAALREGLGIGLLPCWAGDADERLVRILPAQAFTQPLWLVLHRDLRHAARIRVAADFFVRELSREAPRLLGRRR